MVFARFNVLLVDDNHDKLMLLRVALQMAGYDVRTATDGFEALKAVKSEPPDLVITDVTMPRMDGYELTRRLRSNPETRFIPVIIQTALRSTSEDHIQAAQVGALGHITDPSNIDLLLARVRTLLDYKNYMDSLDEALLKERETLPETTKPQEMAQRKLDALKVIKRKLAAEDFDVFLCHNNKDKDAVKKIAVALQENEILPWLDEWQLQPGLPWQDALEKRISKIKSAAVFVGANGIGPWQKKELNAFLREFIGRGCSVIPVLLDTAPEKPELPNFLAGMTWVDFRKTEPDPMRRLIWGITGEREMA